MARGSAYGRLSEDDWQEHVIGIAQARGWLVAHFKPAQLPNGRWVTPVKANGKGFPDLVLVRERVVWAELKSQTGKLSAEQRVWLETLETAGEETYVWKPSMLEEVKLILARPPIP